MKRRHSIWLVALLVMALAVPLFGGSHFQGSVASADTTADREPYEFTMYFNYDWYDITPVWGQDETSKVLKDKFNITLKMSKPDTDPDTKMNLMLASGDLPDVLMLDRGNAYYTMAQNGMLYPLDNLIDNGSNYQRLLAQDVRNTGKINGVTYAFLNWATSAEAPTGNNCFALNKNIYVSLGSPPITTLDELYSYLKLVQKQSAVVDGMPIIPMQATIHDFYSMYGEYNRGLDVRFSLFKDGDKLSIIYKDPLYREALKYMNKLYGEGLINQDIYLEKSEQVLEKLSTGRIAAYVGTISDQIAPSRLKLQEADPTNDYLIIDPPAGPGVNQKNISFESFDTLGWNVIAISNKAAKPERIFELFDYLYSEEGTALMYYGPKGFLYNDVDESGVPYLTSRPSDYSQEKQKKLGLFVWGFPGNSVFANKMVIALNERQPADKRDWLTDNQVKTVWPHSTPFTEFSALLAPSDLTDPNSKVSVIRANFNQYDTDMLPKIIMASPDEVDSMLDSAINDVTAMGIEQYENYCTQLWKNSK